MSSVVIDYGKLDTISKNANNAANKMNDYINDLTRNVRNKYSDINGGSSSKTQNSDYYVKSKIASLRTKQQQYISFAKSVSRFSSKAQEIDKGVARKIKASKDNFIKNHDYIKSNWWTDLKNWYIDLKNACPLLEAIGNLLQVGNDAWRSLFEELKYWYKCGGGKEKLGFALAIAGAIAAVVIAVCALVPPVCGLVAICAAIGAVIGALNAVVNVFTSYTAMKRQEEGDLGWAKIYEKQDSAADWLRQTNHGNKFLNDLCSGAATALDITETVCSIVDIYDGLKHASSIVKEIKLSAQKGKVSFLSRLKDYAFNTKAGTDGKGNVLHWRDMLQDRGEIRTLRTQNKMYSVTKAKTLENYNRTLSRTKKMANKVSQYAKYGRDFTKYTQKLLDYNLNGDASLGSIGKDIVEGFSDKFSITKTAFDTYDLFKDNTKNLKTDYAYFKLLIN